MIALLWSGSILLAFIAGVGANHVWKLLLRDVHDDDAPLFIAPELMESDDAGR